jgi:hypothetical protein
MSIYLNGTKVPGFNQKISVQLNLAGEDMSGQGSHTPQAETGDKPKEIGIALEIRFTDEADLKRLVTLAESKNGSDERMIYNIINNTTQAMNIRQVRFQGSLQVRENEDLALWMVSFNLIEYSSVAEKKQARGKGMTVGNQSPTGTPIAASTETPSGLSAFEKVIKKASEILR